MDGISLQQVISRLTLGSVCGLVATDYTMVYGIISMISFAHGEVYMISAYLSAIALALLAFFDLQNFPLLILGTLLLTALVICTYGWVIERIAYKSLRNSTCLASLTPAIGISLILQNYVQIAQRPRQQGIPTLLDGVLKFHVGDGSVRPTYTKLFILITSLVGMAVLIYVIRYTKLGRMCRVTQQDCKMVSILGINTDRVTSYVFVIGTVMAALAGMLITMNYDTFDFCAGFIAGIKAFVAAVFGGVGSLPGAMLDSLVPGVAEARFSGMVNTDYKDALAFPLLVLILIFRLQGLLGRPQIVKV